MPPLVKTNVVASIQAQLQHQYDRTVAAAREAHGYATDQDSKAESKYDTRSLEASYLASGQAAKAEELAAALKLFTKAKFPGFAATDPIDLGALVQVKYPDRSKAAFLLVTQGGGIICEHEGSTVMVVTPGAPVFTKLQGRRVGDQLIDPEMEIIGVC
ncbi:MAG: transcription elongation factor GreAB [Verrucomicrobiae bacterium]|nr:transcription elongation factor GreAB [Verrucomicrobiae bacterium]